MSALRKRDRESASISAMREVSPRRVATVYDAVAGRIGYESFLKEAKTSKRRDTRTSTSRAVYPEEVLFRRKGAPQRFEENDVYFAHEQLDSTTQRLPESDLLKSLHSYASAFYSRATPNGGRRDWRSMEETALLTLGMLLEETLASKLGETGDLAFVQGGDEDGTIKGLALWDGRDYRQSVMSRAVRPGKSNSWGLTTTSQTAREDLLS